MESNQLESLWNQYADRLLGFIRSRISDPAEAEDILQEVFLRIHRSLCCLPMDGRLDRWIYTITRNLIIDRYRRRRAEAELPDDLAAGGEPEEESPEEQLALSLREMIDTLPEHYRDALWQTEYQGLTQEEYARRAGISLSGAKSRVQRARRMLRDLFLACCHFEMDRRGGILEYSSRCRSCEYHSPSSASAGN